jgi:CHASE2 domain-containing sensor protein
VTARAVPAVHGAAPGRLARIRLGGVALLILLAVLTALGAPWTERLQAAWFDAHQALYPREVTLLPVTIVGWRSSWTASTPSGRPRSDSTS